MRTPVIVYPHTHWDREWYEPEARFRQRLIPVVEEILRLLEVGQLPCFVLDGQTILIRDYLRARPEDRVRVRALARSGKLILGPWFVLSDELLPADETLVRNLLLGRADGSLFGGWMPVGYSPDAFGHPAALPALLAGFGIRHAILWRGYGGEPGQDHDCFVWAAPDGSSVLVHHLPPQGYEVGASLPTARAALAARWRHVAATLAARADGRPLLLPNGADHHAPQRDLPEAVARLRRIAPRYAFEIASPVRYFEAIGTAAAPQPPVHGELRFSYRYAWTLQGVHATRARLKAAVAEGERLLLRWAEPQAALAAWAGGSDRRALVDAAWREHVANTFHDSIGGCTCDAVARDVARRADHVSTAARGILTDALEERIGQDRARARREPGRWQPTLVVANPSPQVRNGTLEATITVRGRRVPVGPPTSRRSARAGRETEPAPPTVVDHRGRPLPMQVVGSYAGYERLDSPEAYPLQHEVTAYRVVLRVDRIAALGTTAFAVARRGRRAARLGDAAQARDRAIANARFRVAGGAAGFTVGDRETGARWRGVGQIVSERDVGDAYTFQPTSGAPVTGRWLPARPGWRGPLAATLVRAFTVGDRARGLLHARLDAGSGLVRLVVEGENVAENHRLRIVFPLPGSLAPRSVADMQYGPVFREHGEYERERFPLEWPVGAAPMHRYVSVPGGLTIMARGLYEYELTADGALAVTLFRAVGDLSRGDLPARPGHAGWPAATPEAQELGAFRAELAMTPVTVSEDEPVARWDEMEQLAEEFHAPLGSLMLSHGIGVPRAVRGPALSGRGLAFKSLKVSERGDALVLRCVNLIDERTQGTWRFPAPVRRARLARLDERPLSEPVELLDGRTVRFDVEPRSITTLLVDQ